MFGILVLQSCPIVALVEGVTTLISLPLSINIIAASLFLHKIAT